MIIMIQTNWQKSLCIINLHHIQVSVFGLNFWNKWANVFRCTYRWSMDSIFTTGRIKAKSPNEIWSVQRLVLKTERFGVEFEQRAMGSLQLLALMRIITRVITLAYLREWRGRTSGCASVCVWVGARAWTVHMTPPSISLVVSPSFPESQYLFVSPQ